MTKLTEWARLVRYVSTDGSIKYGEPDLSEGNRDINKLAKEGKLTVTVLKGDDPLSATSTGVKDTVKTLLGPLRPKDVSYVRCIGLNYKTHSGLPEESEFKDHNLLTLNLVLETGRPLPTCPTVFTKPGTTIADMNEPIPIPKIAQSHCDYEGELTILIGKDAKDVSEEEALDYVGGYTVGNDVSARDWQREAGKAGPVPQWGFSKSFDKYAPLGPCLVSPSVLGAADKQQLKTFVNGEERQTGNTSDLCFGVRALIAFCSQGQTLQAGSLIMTGTPGGVGLFMQPPGFLKDGDEVVVEIEGIGRLVNTMKFE